jgi:RNA polymerase primary sigma factor
MKVERIKTQLQKLKTAISKLPTKEQLILNYRFGLETGKSQSLMAVSKRFDVSTQKVREVETKVLRQICKPKRMTSLNGFLG